jgi:hypothetical protein
MAKEMILHALWPLGLGPTSSKISPKGITIHWLPLVQEWRKRKSNAEEGRNVAGLRLRRRV